MFFCLLAGPDNVVSYVPDLLINNGIALTAAMLLAALVFAVVFPADMSWLICHTMGDLRSQARAACKDELSGPNRRFQSSTHDLISQLRVLLTHRSRRRRDALRWMLATIEVGHAVIDLHNEVARADYAEILQQRWRSVIEHSCDDLARLFARPDAGALDYLARPGHAANGVCGSRSTSRSTAHPELSALHSFRVARQGRAVQSALSNASRIFLPDGKIPSGWPRLSTLVAVL
nr:FUSC family protein [Paraburkholderia sp. HP33-1]